MTNYEAIIKLDREAMECFLDQIYCAGLNNGMYAARHDDEEILCDNPFDSDWLEEPAEKAIEFVADESGDDYMLNGLVKAVFRNAGISLSEQD